MHNMLAYCQVFLITNVTFLVHSTSFSLKPPQNKDCEMSGSVTRHRLVILMNCVSPCSYRLSVRTYDRNASGASFSLLPSHSNCAPVAKRSSGQKHVLHDRHNHQRPREDFWPEATTITRRTCLTNLHSLSMTVCLLHW